MSSRSPACPQMDDERSEESTSRPSFCPPIVKSVSARLTIVADHDQLAIAGDVHPEKPVEKRTFSNRCLVPIVLQKSPSGLCEIEICNYRIGAPVLLNRCCAFQPD